MKKIIIGLFLLASLATSNDTSLFKTFVSKDKLNGNIKIGVKEYKYKQHFAYNSQFEITESCVEYFDLNTNNKVFTTCQIVDKDMREYIGVN